MVGGCILLTSEETGTCKAMTKQYISIRAKCKYLYIRKLCIIWEKLHLFHRLNLENKITISGVVAVNKLHHLNI